MKIIIEHYGTKRVIEGDGFNICGSAEDLNAIASQIQESVRDSACYGWHEIREKSSDPHLARNEPPLPWK